MKKILIAPSSYGKLSDEPIQRIVDEGFQPVVNPFGRKLTKSETLSLAKDCVGAIAGLEDYDKEVIDSLPELKVISRVGVGMDSIDIDYATSKHVRVLNTPDGPTKAVAEMALGLVMTSLRKISEANYNFKSGNWKKSTGFLLEGKQIGILGLGRIGKSTAKIFRSLGNEVFAYDLFPDVNWCEKNKVQILSFDELLTTSDILILHLSQEVSGEAVLGKSQLDLLKDESFLINLSRGGIVDEDALINCLNGGKFRGVALDVFSKEPYEGPLTSYDRVTVTPHLGSYATEGKIKMEVQAADNLIKALKYDK